MKTPGRLESLLQDLSNINYFYSGGDASASFIKRQIAQAERGTEASVAVPFPDAVFPVGDQLVPGTLMIAKNAPFSETAKGLISGEHIPPKVDRKSALLVVPIPTFDGTSFSRNLRVAVGENPSVGYYKVHGIIYGFNEAGAPLLIRPGDAYMFGTAGGKYYTAIS